MTPKERWLAAIRLQPVDRLPFWPKLTGSYPVAQSAPFHDQSVEDIQRWVGSDRHVSVAQVFREQHRRCERRTAKENGTRRTTFRTPHGDLIAIEHFDAPSCGWHPVRFPIQTPEDLRWLTAFYEDTEVELDPAGVSKAREQHAAEGDQAVTAAWTWESPLMCFVEHLAGVETAHFLLHDCPEEVRALFAAMHRILCRQMEITAAHTPADIIYLTENTSTTLISPEQYRQFCVPHIRQYGGITRAADKPLVLHMCGHLKAILPDLAQLPVEAFEAFTAPTLGNTTLWDGRTQCPNQCLIGGTHAMLWLRTADEIIAQIEHDLDVLPHHRGIVVTSAGVMPPACSPATIRRVADWIRSYRVRL